MEYRPVRSALAGILLAADARHEPGADRRPTLQQPPHARHCAQTCSRSMVGFQGRQDRWAGVCLSIWTTVWCTRRRRRWSSTCLTLRRCSGVGIFRRRQLYAKTGSSNYLLCGGISDLFATMYWAVGLVGLFISDRSSPTPGRSEGCWTDFDLRTDNQAITWLKTNRHLGRVGRDCSDALAARRRLARPDRSLGALCSPAPRASVASL